ncbi:rubrerythrin [Bacilli bacterium PM5-3]|nr:rubrerythrin [Bacilli bacterium PM5-3]MDH6603563.1 rubrerythrin [Bacilli bacterium PM5-9]
MIYNAGDKPEKGNYVCTVCGYVVTIDENNDTLPVCPLCGVETYEKE